VPGKCEISVPTVTRSLRIQSFRLLFVHAPSTLCASMYTVSFALERVTRAEQMTWGINQPPAPQLMDIPTNVFGWKSALVICRHPTVRVVEKLSPDIQGCSARPPETSAEEGVHLVGYVISFVRNMHLGENVVPCSPPLTCPLGRVAPHRYPSPRV